MRSKGYSEELSYCRWNLDLTQVCLYLVNYSLRHNGLTATGAIALARALEHNKSLEELK